MIKAGEKLDTSFTLDILENGEIKRVRFSELLDRPVIVSVYMRNNTSGCDRQNRSLADKASEIMNEGYKLIALSKDTCGSHKKYAGKFGIDYILASDPDHLFAKATGSLKEKKMYGKTFWGPGRSAYFVDTDGTVQAVIEKIDTERHADELLDIIRQLKSRAV
jgi:thioredoxin-dependent peroxiredoxin